MQSDIVDERHRQQISYQHDLLHGTLSREDDLYVWVITANPEYNFEEEEADIQDLKIHETASINDFPADNSDELPLKLSALQAQTQSGRAPTGFKTYDQSSIRGERIYGIIFKEAANSSEELPASSDEYGVCSTARNLIEGDRRPHQAYLLGSSREMDDDTALEVARSYLGPIARDRAEETPVFPDRGL